LNLGEKLVRKHGYKPSSGYEQEQPKSTDALVKFIIWLDKHPEAREELEELGYSFHRTNPFS